jgi:hypothetical protein
VWASGQWLHQRDHAAMNAWHEATPTVAIRIIKPMNLRKNVGITGEFRM